MLKKLQLDAATSDLTAINALLEDRAEEDDPIGFYQFTARKAELESKIGELSKYIEKHAEIGVFFGGGPVQGSRGINADFAGKALEDLQALISKRFSEIENGILKQRGRLPLFDQSQMLVTGVVRGSFGFVLEESSDTEEIVATPLREVVDGISDLLARVGSADELVFDEAASELDERILVTLKQFFQRLDEQDATIRIVSGNRDFLLDRSAVTLARNRIQKIEIIERGDEFVGTLFVLPESRRFDFITEKDQTILKGVVGPYVLKQLAGQQELNEAPIDARQIPQKLWRVEIKTREIREKNREPRLSYTLKRIQEL